MKGLLTRLFDRATPPAHSRRGFESSLLEAILSGEAYRTAAGISVTPDSALTYSAVWACVRVLAESIGSLPLILYRRLPNGGKERAIDHPLYGKLHDAPNPEMTSTDWRESEMVNLALWGNGYSQIVPDKAGRVLELWPMHSRYMELKRDLKGELVYASTQPGLAAPTLAAKNMLHVRSMSLNGLQGLSPIAMARQAVGLGLATESYGAAFFGNGANPGIILEHPGILNDEAYARVKNSWTERSGVENAHKPVILEEGMKIDKIGVPPEDAQFLETRKFQVDEVARWFRIPPHMIGDLEHATFSNIEHQALDFVVHTLRPWLVRWEQAISRSLLTDSERQTLFPEFLVDGMLRGDITSRYSAYAVARNWGWLSVNDIRERENMNPVPGGAGYLAPLNMTTLDQVGNAPAATPTAARDAALGYLYRDAIVRITQRMRRDVAASARKFLPKGDGEGFDRWLNQFAAETQAFIERSIEPVAMAHAELCGIRTQNPGAQVSKWAVYFLREELDWIRHLVDGARVAGIAPVDALDEQLRRYDDPNRLIEWAREITLLVAGEEN